MGGGVGRVGVGGKRTQGEGMFCQWTRETGCLKQQLQLDSHDPPCSALPLLQLSLSPPKSFFLTVSQGSRGTWVSTKNGTDSVGKCTFFSSHFFVVSISNRNVGKPLYRPLVRVKS